MKNSEKFAFIVIGIAILYCIFVIIFALYKVFNSIGPTSLNFYYFVIVLGIISVFFLSVILRLSNNFKINFSILILTITIFIYCSEIFLFFKFNKESNLVLKKFDNRTKIEVINDFNKMGQKAYPSFYPHELIEKNGIDFQNSSIFPLSGLSNSKIILCSEGGIWIDYDSDKYGFNNSKEVYDNQIDIALIGDSYTEGVCVNQKDTISSKLNSIGLKSVSFGKSGNGPLIEFATFKEYVLPLKPKIVLWLYYENDLVELKRELRSSLLKKYINNINFSQNLISKQNQINLVLEEYIGKKILESQIIKKNKKNSFNPLSRNITNIIKLFNLRSLFKLNPGFDSEDIIAKKFIEIIDTTDQLISDWNGKLYFVYLPAYSKYSVGKDFGYYNSIIHIIKKLGIEVIDIHEEGFSNHPDPISLYTFRLANHYNVDGYELVSKIIKKRLDQE